VIDGRAIFIFFALDIIVIRFARGIAERDWGSRCTLVPTLRRTSQKDTSNNGQGAGKPILIAAREGAGRLRRVPVSLNPSCARKRPINLSIVDRIDKKIDSAGKSARATDRSPQSVNSFVALLRSDLVGVVVMPTKPRPMDYDASGRSQESDGTNLDDWSTGTTPAGNVSQNQRNDGGGALQINSFSTTNQWSLGDQR
jgi:hypothetical protein